MHCVEPLDYSVFSSHRATGKMYIYSQQKLRYLFSWYCKLNSKKVKSYTFQKCNFSPPVRANIFRKFPHDRRRQDPKQSVRTFKMMPAWFSSSVLQNRIIPETTGSVWIVKQCVTKEIHRSDFFWEITCILWEVMARAPPADHLQWLHYYCFSSSSSSIVTDYISQNK